MSDMTVKILDRKSTIQGAPIKNNPVGKLHFLTVTDFFTKFMAFTEEDSGRVSSKFRCNICYDKNYNHLNLKLHFSN